MVLEETERDLVDRCRNEGTPDAFRLLFERYKDKVYSIALRYSGDPSVAQDITQETFLKLFATIGRFRGEASFDSWLYRLVVNACFDQKRRHRRLTPLLDGFLDRIHCPSASALDCVVQKETADQVRTVVDALPPDQRMIIFCVIPKACRMTKLPAFWDARRALSLPV